MNITVKIITEDDNATLSVIEVDGEFVCFGLEDEQRAFKIPGETRIPRGKYSVGVRTHGGFHSRYSLRYSNIHAGMLEIKDVPMFTDILIHCGNTDDDTAGCLLVGTGCNSHKGLRLVSSVLAYKVLYTQVIAAALAGELWIEFVSST
jgi:hypothetical protein